MFRRIGFFVLTNVLIIATISIMLSIFGVTGYLEANGINYQSLAIFCLIWGMGGSFISLLLSRWMAKMTTRAQVIDPAQPGQFGWVVDMVHNSARNARLSAMPEVAVYPSNEVNAFATGPSQSKSLVAVSAGLLQAMNKREIEGVIAHEVAHIKNGDMVSMTLLQGLVNAFGMFLARVVSFFIAQALAGDRDGDGDADISHFTMYALTFLFDIVFTLLGSIAVAKFSRAREFRADAGSARILGDKSKMIEALQALQRMSGAIETEKTAVAAFKISGRPGWMSLFSTHPPLEERIAALQSA